MYHLRPAWLRQAFFLIALACAVCAGQASACVGSADPLIQRLEIEVGRNPLAALDSIAQEIADTDPLDKRRLAELYIVQAKALNMGGLDSAPALKKARSAASKLSERAPANILLQMNAYYDLPDDRAKRKALASLVRSYQSLPDGSSAKTCRAVDLAFNYSFQEKPREAFTFASQAYLNSADDKSSPARAEAASALAYLVSNSHDFDYAKQLHSEALAIQLKLGMSDLAANELLVRGYTELKDGDWIKAVADFRESAKQARSYDNQYAVDYALLGVCQAALEGGKIADAAPECERAYQGLGKPDEAMALPATALMAKLLVERGDPGRALAILDPMIAKGKQENASDDWLLALEIRAQALFALGRNAQAYEQMREASEAAKAFHDTEMQSGTAALQARFQTRELQHRLAEEERASSTRLRLAIAVIAGSTTTLLLLGTLIFFLLRNRRRFRRLAMTDPLTGLANRRATLERVSASLPGPDAPQPRASFALLDIDHFKSCNDTFGHDAGDQVLSQFARVVERCVRPTDIVGRWGGEEFLVILPATGLEDARDIIERVRSEAALEEFDFAPGYRLRFSAGIAMPSEAGGLTDACLKLADRRLYAAKHHGRNRTCIDAGIAWAGPPAPPSSAGSGSARAA
ncbi:diguanylate cyclase [Alteriqipengyuania sp. NZ-12B]|uniref:diguanylate cyclase n=1 Tax=Alteriqipengyuania abyssalis TaxID=2860200 RepID=A0ABS7PF12_9SPHN|nr:diguanylate cyclase [Alteriqipengyuania abyssalis]